MKNLLSWISVALIVSGLVGLVAKAGWESAMFVFFVIWGNNIWLVHFSPIARSEK